MIRISNLNKYYNKNKSNAIHVINDISLELPDTGMVAIFGRSGCGKTTCAGIIAKYGYTHVNTGDITRLMASQGKKQS